MDTDNNDSSHLKLLDAIVAMLSHDLRNPLSLIQMNAALLAQDGSLTPAQRARIDDIKRAVSTMGRMISTLLDASRISEGKLPIQKEKVDVVEDVLKVVEEFIPLAERRGLKLNASISDHPIWARYDSGRIRQVLGNLIANAIKYADTGSTIDIIITKNISVPSLLRFEVRNKGEIIPPEHRKKIFERFTQVGEERSHSDPESIGLGLWIADWIVTAHGGRIWVEETSDHDGNSFCFLLPRDVSSEL